KTRMRMQGNMRRRVRKVEEERGICVFLCFDKLQGFFCITLCQNCLVYSLRETSVIFSNRFVQKEIIIIITGSHSKKRIKSLVPRHKSFHLTQMPFTYHTRNITCIVQQFSKRDFL